jgi:hypothetical protein
MNTFFCKKTFLTAAIALLFTCSALAQAPQKISFQAVVRNGSNVLVTNGNVSIRISLVQGSTTGTTVYSETHNSVTNANGLATLQIGAGTVLSGNFASIDWANGPYFIKTEADPSGGTNYALTSVTQLLSVPYSLYAEKSSSSASSWNINGNTGTNPTTNFIGTTDAQDVIFKTNNTEKLRITSGGNFGIGTSSPLGKLHVNNDVSGADSSVVITTEGKLGIGTINPTRKLDVNGNVKIADGTQGNGKILTSDANGNASWQTLSTGGVLFTNMQVYANAGSFTFTVPAGFTKIMVEVWGAGGGGSCSNNYAGGGGAYGKGVYTVTPSTNYAVTVGAGGTGGATGANGGNSSFGALISANGGSGSGGFGLGGTSTAPFNISGGDCYSTNSIYGINGGNGANGGQGGRTPINSTDNSGNGRNGVAPGGGGGNCGGGTTGGNGAQGRVVIYY